MFSIKIIASLILGTAIVLSGYSFYIVNQEPESVLGGGTGTINQLQQWLIATGGIVKLASSTADIRVPSLQNCDTIDTDGNGVFECGTDGGGGGGIGTTTPWTAGDLARVVDGDTLRSISTSTLGLLTTHVTEGSNLYYTIARLQSGLLGGYNAIFGNATTSDFAFTGEIKPDGELCDNGEILKKTGSNDWACGTDATGSGGGLATSSPVSASNLLYYASNGTAKGTATGTLSESVDGLEFNASRYLVGGSAALSLSSGFSIPLTASTSNWNTFYNTPSNRITAGDALTWSSNTLNFDGGNTPAGDLGGTWASPSVTDDSHAHTGATLSAIGPTNFSSTDFGSFTCNGTICTLDASSINESMLNINTATAGYVMQASSTASGGFAWVATSTLGITGGGSSLFTDAGSFTYLTSTTDDLVLGSNSTTTAPFWFESNDAQLKIGDSREPIIGSDNLYLGARLGSNASTTGIYVSDLLTQLIEYDFGTSIFSAFNGFIAYDVGNDIAGIFSDDLLVGSTEDLNFNFGGTNVVTVSSNTGASRVAFSGIGIDASTIRSSVVGSVSSPNYQFTADTNTGMYKTSSGDANSLSFTTGGSNQLTLNTLGGFFDTNIFPDINDGAGLGSSTRAFSDLFLAEGGVINWDNSDFTLTQTNNILAAAGGGLDFGSADFLEIPNGTGPTANDPGEIAHDTTGNQLVIDDYVIPAADQRIWGTTIGSTSPEFISGGLLSVPVMLDGYTITRITCKVDGGTSKVIAIEDASGNSSEDITCGTTPTNDDGSITNATYTGSEEQYIDFGATSGSVNTVSISVFGNWTRE